MGIRKKFIEFAFEGELKEKQLRKLEENEKSARARKEEKKISLSEKLQEKLHKEEKTSTQGGTWFYDDMDSGYDCVIINKKAILDKDKKSFSDITGQKLLKRDLSASPLYLEDEGNLMKVISTTWVRPEDYSKEKAFVMLKTKYDYFVTEFDVTISF